MTVVDTQADLIPSEFASLKDIDLAEKLVSLTSQIKSLQGCKAEVIKELSARIMKTGSEELKIDEETLIVLKPQTKKEYDLSKLVTLKNMVDKDKLFVVLTNVPSGKQLAALSDIAGAAVQSVVNASIQRYETGKINIKIRKPAKRRRKSKQ